MKRLAALLLVSGLLITGNASANNGKDSLTLQMEQQQKLVDSIKNALQWETNTVTIGDGIARLKIKKGFKFLNAQQSRYVLHDLWGNPPREDVLGMIFPENGGPFADSSFAFIVSYEATGFVKDDDAEDINYDDMLKEIQQSEPEANKPVRQKDMPLCIWRVGRPSRFTIKIKKYCTGPGSCSLAGKILIR